MFRVAKVLLTIAAFVPAMPGAAPPTPDQSKHFVTPAKAGAHRGNGFPLFAGTTKKHQLDATD